MGRPFSFAPLFLSIVAGLSSEPAQSATEVPLFLQIENAQTQANTRPAPVRVLLSAPLQTEGSDPLWISLRPVGASGASSPRLAFASLAPVARAVVKTLLARDSENFSATSGWEIGLRGLKREAVVVSWLFVVREGDPRRGPLRELAFRPTFYVPGEGLLEVIRSLSLEEVRSRAFTLNNPTDFRLTRRPASAASTGLILGQAPDTAPGAPDGLLSVPGVVVLRDTPAQRAAQVLSATLWSTTDSHGSEYRLTFRIDQDAHQIVLPQQGIREAMLALQANQNFQGIQVGALRYEGLQPVHLETLIVDLRGGHPSYYFLLRKQHPDRADGDLQLVEASQVKAIAPSLPAPRPLDHSVAVYSRRMDAVVEDFMHWRVTAPLPPAGLERDLFSWYLAQSRLFFQAPALGFPEALVVIERLCTQHQVDLCDAPLGTPRLSLSDFRTLHGVNVAAASSLSTIWDLPAPSYHSVLEAIARSPTGHELVVAVSSAPLFSQRARPLAEKPLGELLGPTVRDLHLRLVHPQTDPFSLSDLRAAHAVERKVLLELLRLNPALLPYTGGLQPPTDTELITQWGLEKDEVAREWASREQLNCRRAVELLGVSNWSS